MCCLPKNNQKGFAFLELVISVGILALLIHAIASLVIASYDILGYSRTRISARHLANEKIELIRNLPYSQVAVAGGIPPGDLPQIETLERNGLEYTVRLSVVYVDDAFDGLAPTDSLPTDYKRVRVDVSWDGTFASDSTITMVTDIAPKGVETTIGGGTLSILIFDANAAPVEGATVRITNQTVNPAIDLTLESNSLGRVLLPGAPVCFECYAIEATKSGYSSDKTYTSLEVAHPDKPSVTIEEGDLTEISFNIDRLSSLTVRSTLGRSNNYATLANQFFQLTGTKIIGTDIESNSVYKYSKLLQTGDSGTVTINDLEWDTYAITVPAATWDLAGSNPLSPFILLPATNLSAVFASVAHQDYSLLLRTIDASGSGVPLVKVHLTEAGGGDTVMLTGEADQPDFGQAFFSPLIQTIYDVEATKSGYLTTSFQATVSGTMRETAVINLQ